MNVFTTPTASIWVPFTSPANAGAAQLALEQVNAVVKSGFLAQINWAGGSGVLPAPAAPAFLGGAVVTVGGGGSNLGLIPSTYYSLSNASSAVVAAIGGANTTVVSGNQSTLIYQNTSTAGEIYLGGGNNYIRQAFTTSAALITVDGGPSGDLGSGAAIIDATLGSSTVRVFANALVNIIAGGAVRVEGQPGTDVIAVSGPSSVPVSVIGGAGVNLIYIPDGGRGQIAPGAGNVIVLAGNGGNETLYGGSATIGGVALNADPFSGSATVFAGSGWFQGGSAGGNNMQTSTIPGAATLIGGGNGDVLQANAAGDLLIAGPGSAVLFASDSATGGVTFVTGSGVTTVIGAVGGNNVIEFGTGASTVYGQHNVGGPGGLTGNTYFDAFAGGSNTIGDFLPGFDVFDVSASAGHPSVQSLTFYAATGTSPFGQVGSQAILSDGTTINFINAAVQFANGKIT
ncbi:MAG: hypothetical protein NT133_25515 [Alphaproteobacteria bacterium]|nr:hypothetical protein [Alphaproteobacteria bacterium]